MHILFVNNNIPESVVLFQGFLNHKHLSFVSSQTLGPMRTHYKACAST